MGPRYDEVPKDWKNLFALTRFRYIEVLFHIFYFNNNNIITRDDVVSQRLRLGSAFLSSSWESKIASLF